MNINIACFILAILCTITGLVLIFASFLSLHTTQNENNKPLEQIGVMAVLQTWIGSFIIFLYDLLRALSTAEGRERYRAEIRLLVLGFVLIIVAIPLWQVYFSLMNG